MVSSDFVSEVKFDDGHTVSATSEQVANYKLAIGVLSTDYGYGIALSRLQNEIRKDLADGKAGQQALQAVRDLKETLNEVVPTSGIGGLVRSYETFIERVLDPTEAQNREKQSKAVKAVRAMSDEQVLACAIAGGD